MGASASQGRSEPAAAHAGLAGLAGLPPRPEFQLEGGVPARPLPARSDRTVEVRFGKSIDNDIRLKALFEREKHFLSVVVPRYRTWRVAVTDWCERTRRPSVFVPLIIVVVAHVGVAVGCTGAEGDDVCAGGPAVDDAATWPTALTSYGAPILSGLATLMLSFYANVCMTFYREAYLACQVLKEAVLDLNTLSSGTISQEAHEIRMEFWRVINLLRALLHLCFTARPPPPASTLRCATINKTVRCVQVMWPCEDRISALHRPMCVCAR